MKKSWCYKGFTIQSNFLVSIDVLNLDTSKHPYYIVDTKSNFLMCVAFACSQGLRGFSPQIFGDSELPQGVSVSERCVSWEAP